MTTQYSQIQRFSKGMMLYIVVFDGQAIFKCVKKVSTYNQSHIRLLFLDEYVDT